MLRRLYSVLRASPVKRGLRLVPGAEAFFDRFVEPRLKQARVEERLEELRKVLHLGSRRSEPARSAATPSPSVAPRASEAFMRAAEPDARGLDRGAEEASVERRPAAPVSSSPVESAPPAEGANGVLQSSGGSGAVVPGAPGVEAVAGAPEVTGGAAPQVEAPALEPAAPTVAEEAVGAKPESSVDEVPDAAATMERAADVAPEAGPAQHEVPSSPEVEAPVVAGAREGSVPPPRTKAERAVRRAGAAPLAAAKKPGGGHRGGPAEEGEKPMVARRAGMGEKARSVGEARTPLEVPAAVPPAKAPPSPGAAKVAPRAKAKRAADPLSQLLAALQAHPSRAALLHLGNEKDQLLRSLIPLYLARDLSVEVSSGTTSRFWARQGVKFAAPNAAKALREHEGYSRRGADGPHITPAGVKYVEAAVARVGSRRA